MRRPAYTTHIPPRPISSSARHGPSCRPSNENPCHPSSVAGESASAAIAGADFRHGPIALAGPKLPAIVVSPPRSATESDLAGLAAELRRRGSPVLPIGPSGRGALPVPRLPELLSPIVSVVPGQLLAFHAARARGLDPDAPAGLTKVTETR